MSFVQKRNQLLSVLKTEICDFFVLLVESPKARGVNCQLKS